MVRLLVVTLAALYTILYVFGDETRRPEVARSEPLSIDLVKAAYLPNDAVFTVPLHTSDISEDEAVQIALAAGVKTRSERKSKPLLGGLTLAAATEAAPTTEEAIEDAPAEYWYVTGTRVNLRSGPGTSNGVVGSLTLGTEALVLADDRGWYQIRTADGSVAGWIFGKYLSEQLPG